MPKETQEALPSLVAEIGEWHARVDVAKAKWQADYDRMRENMRFATGRQWAGQKKIQEDDYVCNLTLKQIRQKVSDLYAQDPTVEVKRKPMMDYQLWDESTESLMEALMNLQMANETGIPDVNAEALLNDYLIGQMQKESDERFCKTLQILLQRQWDMAQPDFKRQMKKLVQRVITCGVGYVRLHFVRSGEEVISEDLVDNSLAGRMRDAMRIADDLVEENDIENSSDAEKLRTIGQSMGVDMDDQEVPERIVFDFLPSTAVIPDTRCRSLQNFIGGRWVCIEYPLPLDEINTMFGTDIDEDSGSQASVEPKTENKTDQKGNPVSHIVREILDLKTRMHFYIMKGYDGYLRAPEPVLPGLSNFWPIFALTFNDVEVGIDADEVTPFPPSDVDFIRHPQKEWNRSRQAWRQERNGSSTKWMCRKNTLSKEDREKLMNAVPMEVVELDGVPADMKLSDVLAIVPQGQLRPEVFGTQQLVEDITIGGGMQEADMGSADPNVTATGVTVAAQSKVQTTSSNRDDLNEFMGDMCQAMGEMSISEHGFSEESVFLLVGRGAAWPNEGRFAYKRQVNIGIKAGSMGKPNQALEVQNYNIIAPQLTAAGANPIGVIEEGVKRLGDNLDVSKFYPVGGLGGPSVGQAPGGNMAAPVGNQQLPNGAPVPAGAVTEQG